MQTETEKNNNLLLEEINKLKTENETKDYFLSIVSHDLRGPLTNLNQLTKLMKDPDNRNDEMIGMISKSSEQILNLVENLLTWIRTQKGSIPFNPMSITIKSLIQECIYLFENMAAEKKITVLNKVDDDILVYADMNMLRTILRNLISNALKFTNSGGVVKIYNDIHGNDFQAICIEDNGIGMSEKILNEIFEIKKNFTSVGTAGEKGSGLGLVIAKEFVTMHGGVIKAKSKEGNGSCFTFTLKKLM